MNTHFTCFELSTGKIRRILFCAEEHQHALPLPDEGVIVGDSSTSQDYINNMQITHRPAQATVLTNTLLTSYPEGAMLEIKGEQYLLDGSDVTLAFELPGDYPIKVTCWPYLDWEGVIHVD